MIFVTLGNTCKFLLLNIISKLLLKNWHFLMHDIMGLRKCQYGTAAEQPLLEILTATLSCKF